LEGLSKVRSSRTWAGIGHDDHVRRSRRKRPPVRDRRSDVHKLVEAVISKGPRGTTFWCDNTKNNKSVALSATNDDDDNRERAKWS
jgi:hypothetical protein